MPSVPAPKFLVALALALCGIFALSALPSHPSHPTLLVHNARADGGDAAVNDLRKGREMFRKKNSAQLQKFAADAHPVAQPMLQYWRARLLLRKGQVAAAEEFIQAQPEPPSPFLAAELRRDLLRHLADKKEWKTFGQFAHAAGTCPRLLHRQNTPGQFPDPAELKILWDRDSKFNDPLCNRVHKISGQSGIISDDDAWRKLRKIAGRKKYGAVRNLLRIFPVARYSAVRKIMRAPVRHIRAKHGLRTRLNRELVVISAMAAVRSRPSTAISRWKKFSQYFGESENADVYAVLGEWSARWGRPDALELFRKSRFDSLDESGRAWRVRAALRAGDFDEVAETVDAMPPEEKTVTAWRYWRAFAARQKGDAALARSLWQDLADADDFYGLLAREELNLPLVNPDSRPDPAGNGAPPNDSFLALALRGIGLDGTARKMWRRAAAAANPENRLAAARLAAAAEWHLAAIYAADGVPGGAAHALRFPRPYAGTIDKYADDRGLDRAFVYGLIRQESRFMPKIVSSAKARGLMQVMPATAKRVARRHGYGKYRLARLTRVDTNVIIGTRYLADLGGSLGNHPVLMAAAYNAGPGRAKRWTKRGGEWLVYIETIPITETRLYVKHVLANRAHYDHALGRENGGKMREVILRPANRDAAKTASIRQTQKGPEFGKKFGPVAGVAPLAVLAEAEMESAGLGRDPDFTRRRLAVHNHRAAPVRLDFQHAADRVKVHSGGVQQNLRLGEDAVADFVKIGFAHHRRILQ